MIASLSFSAGDPEELKAGARLLSWDSEYVPLGSGFETEVAAVHAGPVQLIRVNFHAPSVAWGDAPPDTYVFALMRSGEGSARLGGEPLTRTNVGLIRPGQGYEFHTTAGAELMLVGLARERLRAVAAEAGEELEDRTSGSAFPVRGSDATRDLAAGWFARLQALRRSPMRIARPETARQLEERLLDEILDPLVLRPGPDLARRTAPRRAATFLRANWARRLRLADLCRVAACPERTLRQGFEELYGRAPIGYLRSIRLREARARLQSAGADQRVGDIALSCGFSHFGNFSAEYRREFGETPSQTLRG